jgi:type II secretory pathway pseudopilin PulG
VTSIGDMRRKTRRARGFTLAELVFGFLIIAILLGLAVNNLKFSSQKEGPRSFAYALASDIRAARAEAQRSGKIVAVCFPSEGRTNSLSQSAILRKGEQRGHLSRIIGYGDDYDATVFLGTWPGASVDSGHEIPVGWSISTQDAMAIYFRPDGSAFSNEIPELDGNYPLVVASSYQGSMNGPNGQVTHAKNPHTVWVSASGSVSVEEGKVPGGTLPQGESTLAISQPKLAGEPAPTSPTLISASFLPESVEGLETAHIGQNYVSVHPNQKDGDYLEYGFATIEIKAKDLDGGPLTYTLEARASTGDEGEFSVSNLEGQLRYVYDEKEREYIWHTLITWRPPPATPADREYDLIVLVKDPEGNELEVSSRAGLIPKVSSLPPSRLVMETAGNSLYLANLDGSNEIEITKDGEEFLPFFSADGSRLFSFYDYTDGSGRRELRSRIANGTTIFQQLAQFDNVGTEVHFDPTFTFAAILVKDGEHEFFWQNVQEVTTTTDSTNEDGSTSSTTTTTYEITGSGTSTPDKFKILIVNLMSSDPPVVVADDARKEFQWAPRSEGRYKFNYGTRAAIEPVMKGGHQHIESPGYEDETSDAFKIDSHPPAKILTDGFSGTASKRAYNPAAPQWYLIVDGSGLFAKNDDSGDSIRLSSVGNIENDHDNRKHPSWSADGQHATFVENPGSGATLKSMKVLKPDHTALSSPTLNCQISGNIRAAQLSPEGEWVYYLRGGELYRAKNESGASGVNLSSRIGVNIDGYAVSP